MTKFIAVAICVFVTQSAWPCINIAGTKFNGEKTTHGNRTGVVMLKHYYKIDLKPEGVKLEAKLRNATNFNDRSDYCIALMYLGRSAEAVERLQQLETEQPGTYFVAGNLGTALELAGKNEEALRWIKEAIRRNPKAHEGTEWLHVKILEAKIAAQTDADYFKKHSVLELRPDGMDDHSLLGEVQLPPRHMQEAIGQQLAERLQFVKPPDAPVASLLFDYAAIEAATVALESAKGVLQMAVDYGYPTDRVKPLVKLYEQRIAWRKTKQYALYVLLGIAGVGLLFVLYRRGIFVISRKDLKPKAAPPV